MTAVDEVRHAWRALARTPLYTIVAIATLAIGIGATTAAFTVVGSVLLKPLPFAESEQLVSVLATTRGRDSTVLSYPAFQDFHRQQDVFSGFAYITGDGVTYRRAGGSESILAAMVTDDFFPLLRARPAIGRLITPEDNRPGAAPVAVLSHEMWLNDFAGDTRVVGRALDLTIGTYTIVGVLDVGQAYPDWVPGRRAELYIPLESAPYVMRGGHGKRTSHADARTLARLKPGVTRGQAEREMATIAASLAVAYPASDSAFQFIALPPLRDQVVGDIGPAFAVLTVGVVLVLLLACADVANLALVRATARDREIAVRTALGATRGRIARALLAESGLVAVAGGVLGVVLAFAAVRIFVGAAPDNIPRLEEVHLDWRALGAALAATSLAAILCGLAPLAVSGRRDLVPALKAGGRGSSAARRGLRLRSAIVTAQIALSVVLISGAGLLIRSFALLRAVDPGFDTSHSHHLGFRAAEGQVYR